MATLTYGSPGLEPTGPADLMSYHRTLQALGQADRWYESCDQHHVICAVSGRVIPLDQLKYWSAPRQEPYASATEVHVAWTRHGPEKTHGIASD